MANQTPTETPSDNQLWFLRAGQFFLDPKNLKKTWSEYGKWNYEDFDVFLRSLAISLDPQKAKIFQKAGLAEILDYIEKVFSDKTVFTSGNIPKQIFLDYQQEQEEKARAKGEKIRTEEVQKVSAFVKGLEEFQTQLNQHKNSLDEFSRFINQKVGISPLSAAEKEKILPQLTQEFVDSVRATDLPNQTIKSVNLPEEFKEKNERLVSQRWSDIWQETVQRVGEKNSLSSIQIQQLAQNVPAFTAIAVLAQEISQKPSLASLEETVSDQVKERLDSRRAALSLTEPQIEQLSRKISREILSSPLDIRTDWDKAWKKALSETVDNLQPQLATLTVEFSLPGQQAATIANLCTEIKASQKVQEKIIESVISPFPQEKTAAINSFAQNLFLNLSEFPQVDKLSAEKKQQALADYTDGVKAAVLISLFSSINPQNPLTPQEIDNLLSKLSFFSEEQINQLAKTGQIPKNIKDALIQPDQRQPLKIESLNILPQTKEPPAIFKDNTFLNLETNVQKLTANQIKTFFLEKSVNPDTIKEAKNIITNSQSFFLTLKGIKPEDIKNTWENLIKNKVYDPQSAIITELKQIEAQLREFQTNNIPQEYQSSIKQRQELRFKQLQNNQALPVGIPFSKFRGLIEEVGKSNPKLNVIGKVSLKINSLLGKVFGNEKVIFLTQKAAFFVNKYEVFKEQVVGKISNWFWKTGAGQSLKLALQKAGAKGLEEIFKKFSKEGVKKAVTQAAAKGIASFLIKIGVKAAAQTIANTIAPVVGFIVVEVGSWLLKQGVKLAKRAKDFVLTLGGITNGILEGLTGSSDSPEEKKQFIWVFVGIFALIFILPLLSMINIGSAFLSPSKSSSDYGPEIPAISCLYFKGNWSEGEKQMEIEAINKILSHDKYASILCQNNEKIILIRNNSNDWCRASGSDIYITDKCLGNTENALYSLAHETGHIFNNRNNYALYQEYLKIIGGSEGLKESFLCSYPLGKTYGEDFPETIAVFITNQHYPSHQYLNCGKGIDLPRDYPIHYNFIKDKI